ncbi:MAG: hypothetical protein AAGU14_07930 [Eubacteriaceae bacterium]
MKKAGKIALIVLIAIVALYAIYLVSINLMFGSIFSDEHLTQEEITDIITQNTDLFNEAAEEIKDIDNSSFYLKAANKEQIDYVSISLAPVYNRVSVSLIDDDSDKKKLTKMIKSKALFKVLKIKGINAIERYYSESGRMCILFDCGSSSMFYYFGFYYTQDNQPIGWKGQDVSFNQYKNRWIWSETDSSEMDGNYNSLFTQDGVNIYITERIADNWFYFDMRE